MEDDGFGVSEILNEKFKNKGLVSRGRHIVLVGPADGEFDERQRQLIQQEMVLEPILYFSEQEISNDADGSKIRANVNILTFF
jgi:hypothetical protein